MVIVMEDQCLKMEGEMEDNGDCFMVVIVSHQKMEDCVRRKFLSGVEEWKTWKWERV